MKRKSLSKKELISIIKELDATLTTAIADANNAASEYYAKNNSDERGRLAFEVGFLSSRIKYSIALLKEISNKDLYNEGIPATAG